MPGPLILPVNAADALLWVKGHLRDRDLLLRSILIPEAVFIVDLPDRASYAPLLAAVAYWRERGAVSLITRTGNPIVARHLRRNGCVVGWSDCPGEHRYLAPPDCFKKWVEKFHKPQDAAPAPALTAGT